MDNKFAFCKITWLPKYRGELHTDTHYRNIMNYKEEDDIAEGAEAYLFLPYRRLCYGYVHLGRTDPRDTRTIRHIDLRQLGGTRDALSVDGIHIIWIAAHVGSSGICVVGEYRDATVYSSVRDSIGKRRWGWNIRAHTGDARIIPESKRVPLDNVPLRQGNLWYAKSPAASAVRKQALSHLQRLGSAVK